MTSVRAVILVSLAAVLSNPATAGDRQLPGRVIRVIDGDSLVLDVRGSHFGIELAGIDAPELNQPWGQNAARRLQHLLTGAFVVVAVQDDGGAQDLAGTITFKGRDVAYDLLYDGLAWSTRRGDDESTHAITAGPRPPADPYTAAEDMARLSARGLWSDTRPIPPWVWRQRRGGIDGSNGSNGPRPDRPIRR